MAYDALRTLLSFLEVLRPALTEPGYRNAVVVFSGWVLTCGGPHAGTQALVVTRVAGRRHHEAFHRFFSRGTWIPDEVGRLLFCKILSTLIPADAPIRAALDDTLATKKGPEVFGIGSHLDPVRSTKAYRVFAFGHVWVVLAVLVEVPFSRRMWALPVLFRLYRNKKACLNGGGRYRKKTELAAEMLRIVASWAPGRRVEIVADCAYCNATVLRGAPKSVVFYGEIRPDAVLTALPSKWMAKKPGRPRVRGRHLPKPRVLARSQRYPWQHCTVEFYGAVRTIYYKTMDAQWYRGSGANLIRIVIVRVESGSNGIRVFFSTDTNQSVERILQTYSWRWSIEVTFRDLKQHLGFGDSSARKRAAVERTAPFVGFAHTTLVLWFTEGVWRTDVATPPVRPWYRHKRGLCFADVVRAAQRTLTPLDVLDPSRTLEDLREIARQPHKTAPPSGPPLKLAA